MFLNRIPNHVETVRIHDCPSLRIPAQTFAEASILRMVQIFNVGDLWLENESFRFGTRNSMRQVSMVFMNVSFLAYNYCNPYRNLN